MSPPGLIWVKSRLSPAIAFLSRGRSYAFAVALLAQQSRVLMTRLHSSTSGALVEKNIAFDNLDDTGEITSGLGMRLSDLVITARELRYRRRLYSNQTSEARIA